MKLPSKKSIFNSPVKVAIVVFVVVFIVALLILSLSDCQSQTTAEGPPGTSVDAAPHTEESSAGESAAGESPAGESSQTPQDLQAEPDSESDQDLETDQVPDEAAPEPVEVESITIVLSAVAYAKGAEITPDVIILPEDAADKTFTLISSDESIISRSLGRWTAVGEGEARLIAEAPNGVTGYVTVSVYIALEDIVLRSDELTIHRGESASIYFELLPENVTDKTVSFSSDNVNIAEVSEYGVVSGIEPGTAVISVFAGEIERRAAVTVIENVTAIEVSTDRRSYLAGDEGQLLISITPQGATRADLTVAVSGTEITLGGDDTFKAVSHGEVTVTVTAANGVEGVHTFFVVDLEILAEEVFQLTNLEREAGGLHPFEASEPLSITALVRAGEIIEEFSHSRPGGRDFFTAFTENDVEFTVAGENLAAGHRTPEEVLRGWMDSPGHRANIVNPSFYYLGVGVAIDEDGRLYWTQAFTG